MTNDPQPIRRPVKLEGRVAQILNERELVINIGSEAGVSKGMKFAVLADTPREIIDPVTKESLGLLDQEKVKVQAKQVLPKMAVCRTYTFRRVGGELNPGRNIASMLGPERQEYDTFNVENSSFPAPIDPSQSYVKIGDRVRQIDSDQ